MNSVIFSLRDEILIDREHRDARIRGVGGMATSEERSMHVVRGVMVIHLGEAMRRRKKVSAYQPKGARSFVPQILIFGLYHGDEPDASVVLGWQGVA